MQRFQCRDGIKAECWRSGRSNNAPCPSTKEYLPSKIYEQHKQVKTADGRVDAQLMADTIRDARQTEGIVKEIPANQVFDFSYLPAR